MFKEGSKMKSKIIFNIVILLVFGFSSFPCYTQSSNDQRIVGTWIHTFSDGNTRTLVFNADGSGSLNQRYDFTYGISIAGAINIMGLNGFEEFNLFTDSYLRTDRTVYFSPDGRSMTLGYLIYNRHESSENLTSSYYLFQENFALNNISEVFVEGDFFSGSFSYTPNIGFTIGKRIIYDGNLQLLDYGIPDSALAVLNKQELRLLIYSIYAKYGMIFPNNDSNSDLITHFQQFSWYVPKITMIEVYALFTNVDKWNIERIRLFERAVPNFRLNEKDLVGFWGTETDAWKGNEIAIFENNTIIADFQEQNRFFPWNWRGSYRIENGFLVVFVTEQYAGTPDFLLSSNWHWPDGVTYSNGIVVYNTPIKLVFPVVGFIDEFWDEFWGGRVQIGTFSYAFSRTTFYGIVLLE